MDKRKAFEIVLNELKKVNMFCGIYDANNGKKDFMNGIWTVMENIAYNIDTDTGDKFSDNFVTNLINSERKA